MKINLRSNYDSFPKEYGTGSGTVNFYVDNNVYYLEDMSDEKGIALLVEPRAIIPGTYNWMQQKYKPLIINIAKCKDAYLRPDNSRISG